MISADYILIAVIVFFVFMLILCVVMGRKNVRNAVSENKKLYAEYLDLAQKKNEEFQAKQLSLLSDIRAALTDISAKLGK